MTDSLTSTYQLKWPWVNAPQAEGFAFNRWYIETQGGHTVPDGWRFTPTDCLLKWCDRTMIFLEAA